MLTEEVNLVRAGRKVLDLGPKFVVIKKGEHGAMFLSAPRAFVMPAFPAGRRRRPDRRRRQLRRRLHGLPRLDRQDRPRRRSRRAMAYGTVVASFNVEDFSLRRFQRTDRDEIDRRLEQYRAMMAF